MTAPSSAAFLSTSVLNCLAKVSGEHYGHACWYPELLWQRSAKECLTSWLQCLRDCRVVNTHMFETGFAQAPKWLQCWPRQSSRPAGRKIGAFTLQGCQCRYVRSAQVVGGSKLPMKRGVLPVTYSPIVRLMRFSTLRILAESSVTKPKGIGTGDNAGKIKW